MTFEECTHEFPIWKTIIGNYGMDGDFLITDKTSVDDIENWDDPPLEWKNNNDYDCAYPFVVFENGKFERWYFAGQRVNGYLNESTDPDKFFPATYSEDFGWEPYDPDSKDNYNTSYFVPDYILRDELISQGRIKDQMFGDRWLREQVAYTFDSKKYLNGEIFTTFDQIKEFVHANY